LRRLHPPRRQNQAVFLFDGDCGFCSACARFIQRHIPSRAPVLPYQGVDLAELGVTEAECEQSVQWATERGHVSGPVAIGRLMLDATGNRWAGGWRLLGWLLLRRPVTLVAWPVYRWVSRNRHRLPGGTPACALPEGGRSATT
jgi:predicted DCC family thiol-disulfide oxidoreductase YuxK